MNAAPPALRTGSPRFALNHAIYDLTRHPDARRIAADKARFLAEYPLSAEEREALLHLQWRKLEDLGVLPNLLYRYYALHGLPPETFPDALAGRT